MTSINANTHHDDSTGENTMVDILAVATRNTGQSNNITKAASHVIAKRMALGMAAAFDPLSADHDEFARMVPEKMKAFSAASTAMLKQSGLASRRMMHFQSDELTIAAHAAVEMISCGNPVSLAEIQVRFARAWFDRTASSFITMGMLALTGQAATMAPIRETVFANVDRLGR